jgi:hypothetical protein
VLDAPWTALALGALVAGVMFVRYAGDWGRVYGVEQLNPSRLERRDRAKTNKKPDS